MEPHHGILLISGTVSTFYHEQLAHETVSWGPRELRFQACSGTGFEVIGAIGEDDRIELVNSIRV